MSELQQLIPDTREADEILEGATVWFSQFADYGEYIEGTSMWYKIITDLPRDRYLVIFYTMSISEVRPLSIKHFAVNS